MILKKMVSCYHFLIILGNYTLITSHASNNIQVNTITNNQTDYMISFPLNSVNYFTEN